MVTQFGDSWINLTKDEDIIDAIDSLISYGDRLTNPEKEFVKQYSFDFEEDPKKNFARYAVARILLGLPPQEDDVFYIEYLTEVPNIKEIILNSSIDHLCDI